MLPSVPYSDPERQREYLREWIRALTEGLAGGERPVPPMWLVERLEVDHIDPTTKVSHRLWSYSVARRDDELAKCQVLCHACHAEKTARYIRSKVAHGSVTMAVKLRCRCTECLAYRKARNQLARERRRVRRGRG